MNIFPWQKNKNIDRFATLLADEFYSRIQPDVASEHFNKDQKLKNKKSLKAAKNSTQNVNNAVTNVILGFKNFRESQKLGIYGKARFHMKFMERLTELGYHQDVAKKLNEEILLKTP